MDQTLKRIRTERLKQARQAEKEGRVMRVPILDNYTYNLYKAFEKMHLIDGTSKGSRWQPSETGKKG